MNTARKKLGKPLTDAQFEMLRSVRVHGDPMAHIVGMSAHGGAPRTLKVLEDHKLIAFKDGGRRGRPRHVLTPAGRKAEKTGRLPTPNEAT